MAAAERVETFTVNKDAFWEAITDYESYPDFVADLETTEILERTDDSVIVKYVVNKIKRVSYVLEHFETPKEEMAWTMVEADFFKSNDGSWTLNDLGDGDIEITYSIEVGLPALVPKAIVKGMVTNSLPELMKSFANRANELEKSK